MAVIRRSSFRTSDRGKHIESKAIRISKIPVLEAVQKLETCNSVKSLRYLGDADNRHRLIEVQRSNPNAQKVHRKPPGIGAAELNMAHPNATALQAGLFIKDELKNRSPAARAGVCHDSANDMLSSVGQQFDLYDGTVVLKRPLRGRHQSILKISSMRS